MTELTTAPTVSVIIPCYNAAATIEQAIQSALASTGVVIEVIVIDDGSTDSSWSVLETFGERIRKQNQNRGGPYRARNLGAELASGEWLAFLDADDDWMPNKLTNQLAAVTETEGLVYTDTLNFGDTSNVKERQSDSVKLYEGDIFERLLLDNFITFSSVLLRKDWFEKLRGFSTDQHGVQDWDMWLRYSAAGGRVRLCREPLTRYRIHAGQMSNESSQRAADREAVLLRALSSPKGQQVSRPLVRQAFAGLCNLSAANTNSKGHRWSSMRHLIRSALYWPWNMRVYKEIIKCIIGRH